MNIENENNESQEVEIDEIAEMESFVEEVKEEIGIDENLNAIEPEEDPEPEPTEVDESDDDDSGEEDTGTEVSADDSTEEEEYDSDSESDEEGDNAFREEFATRHGFSQEAIADQSVEQLEKLGMEMDRRMLEGLQKPQQQQQQTFQPPQQQFQQPQQFEQPVQQQGTQVNFDQLKKQAEEGGYEEGFIESLDAMQQQHLRIQQQNEFFIQQQRTQQEQAAQASESLFDESLESLDLPEVFGSDRQSALNNGVQFEARKQLYQNVISFSQAKNEPMSKGLVDRVARVMFAGQLKQKQSTELVNKAKSQAKKKLGSGITRTKNQSQQRSIDTGDDEVDSIVNDPEVAAFAEANGML